MSPQADSAHFQALGLTKLQTYNYSLAPHLVPPHPPTPQDSSSLSVSVRPPAISRSIHNHSQIPVGGSQLTLRSGGSEISELQVMKGSRGRDGHEKNYFQAAPQVKGKVQQSWGQQQPPGLGSWGGVVKQTQHRWKENEGV